MRFINFVSCLTLLVSTLWGQGNSGRAANTLGSPPPSWKDAGVVLIGEFTGSIVTAGPAQLRCTGQLLAHRVLQGDVPAGAQLPMSWNMELDYSGQIKPGTQVKQAYGLWAINRTSGGNWAPLFSGSPITILGRAFLPLPRAFPSGELAYSPEAPPGAKLAMELAAALEAMAMAEGNRLTLIRGPVGGAAAILRDSPAVQFSAILRMLNAAEFQEAEPAYRYFSRSADPQLRAAGIVGRLRGGDASAAFDLEREAPFFGSTLASTELTGALFRFPAREQPEALHALARAALSESGVPALEQLIPKLISDSGRLDFLPYLAVLMQSSSQQVHDHAVYSLCHLLRQIHRSGRSSPVIWQPENDKYCPDRSPVPDQAQSQAYVEYWKQWWAANQERIQADPAVPRPSVPSRYYRTGQQLVQAASLSSEQAFRVFVQMTVAAQRARQQRIDQGLTAPEFYTPLAGRLSTEDDRKLAEIAATVSAALEANETKVKEAAMTARVQGAPPSPELIRKVRAEQEEILKNGLLEARRELSLDGWSAIEQHLQEISRATVKIALPAAPKPPAARE
ncbi:MAG: hypothetical protein K6T61_05715 [Bryobacteraceae bacterium]|nr:hypothetical protein [Bryobacteraceae bacterium]